MANLSDCPGLGIPSSQILSEDEDDGVGWNVNVSLPGRFAPMPKPRQSACLGNRRVAALPPSSPPSSPEPDRNRRVTAVPPSSPPSSPEHDSNRRVTAVPPSSPPSSPEQGKLFLTGNYSKQNQSIRQFQNHSRSHATSSLLTKVTAIILALRIYMQRCGDL